MGNKGRSKMCKSALQGQGRCSGGGKGWLNPAESAGLGQCRSGGEWRQAKDRLRGFVCVTWVTRARNYCYLEYGGAGFRGRALGTLGVRCLLNIQVEEARGS